MGYDPATRVGRGCQPGTARLFAYVRERWRAGSLGCFNPASRVPGGGLSLHTEGRAFDAALNAHDPAERARGDDMLNWLVAHHEEVGLQEVLWRGFIWSYKRRHEGIRFGVQQAAHMNHLHVGMDRHAAANWTVAWLSHGALFGDDTEDDMAVRGFFVRAHNSPYVYFIRPDGTKIATTDARHIDIMAINGLSQNGRDNLQEWSQEDLDRFPTVEVEGVGPALRVKTSTVEAGAPAPVNEKAIAKAVRDEFRHQPLS